MGAGDVTANISKISGKALYFDGANDFVEIDYYMNPSIKSSFSFWIKFHVLNKKQLMGTHDGSNHRYYIGLTATNMLFLGLGDAFIDTLASGFSTETWYHMAMTTDGRVGRFYVDGVEKYSLTYANSGASTDAFAIGARERSPEESYMKATINDVRLHGRTLTHEEVMKLAKNKKITAQKTIAAWSFNDPTDPGKDNSGNGYDGTVNGAVSVGGHNTTEDDIISARVNANSKFSVVPLANGQEIMTVHIEEA